jgi:hypothetical protein
MTDERERRPLDCPLPRTVSLGQGRGRPSSCGGFPHAVLDGMSGLGGRTPSRCQGAPRRCGKTRSRAVRFGPGELNR